MRKQYGILFFFQPPDLFKQIHPRVYVYIQEAHPSDGWQVESNLRDRIEVPQPQTIDERRELALTCAARPGLTAPVLLDGMENGADRRRRTTEGRRGTQRIF